MYLKKILLRCFNKILVKISDKPCVDENCEKLLEKFLRNIWLMVNTRKSYIFLKIMQYLAQVILKFIEK